MVIFDKYLRYNNHSSSSWKIVLIYINCRALVNFQRVLKISQRSYKWPSCNNFWWRRSLILMTTSTVENTRTHHQMAFRAIFYITYIRLILLYENIVIWIITIDKHIRYFLRPSYRCYGTHFIVSSCVSIILTLLHVIKPFLLIIKKDRENSLPSSPTDWWIFSCLSGNPII